MAIIKTFPSIRTIRRMAGVVDYYCWMGLFVARAWPTYHPRIPTAAEAANQAAFTYAASSWSLLSPTVQAAYSSMAQNTGVSGRDLYVKSLMRGLYAYPHT